eukprot:TRINITY_DN4663_c0_g4_i2.p1 TRINITY_DN4663_c0_g4~~TRINITY_DN4663_c0_g4_i2.p1  ORF type:complete len:523 (+),score=50.47 TRINITY_DN4663_c0_g4_i2:51-1619(+)
MADTTGERGGVVSGRLKVPLLQGLGASASKGAPSTGSSPGRTPPRSPHSSDSEQANVPWSQKGVQDLHDFTAEFIERGYHAEYCSWRDGYLKWRKGESKGAKGENVERTHIANKGDNFEYWYPTVSSFTFRRTVSYWVGVMFAEGCLLFMWPVIFHMLWPDAPHRMVFNLMKLPLLVGTIIFFVGIYMGYLELINMDTDTNEGKMNFFWCDWKGLLKLLQEESEDEESEKQVYWYQAWSSIAGWVTYMIGAVLYLMGNSLDLFTMDTSWHVAVVDWPLLLGGFFFFLGGLCEVIHNRVWATLPTTLVWWSSVLNGVGGAGYWLSSCPNWVGEEADNIGLFGTVLYLIGAVLSLCMWRGEQFGLNLISNLNRVSRVQGTQIAVRHDRTSKVSQIVPVSAAPDYTHEDIDNVVGPKLSWRGLTFIVVCVVCGVAQLLKLFTVLAAPSAFTHKDKTRWQRLINEGAGSILNVVGIHLIILLNSVSVHVPRDQPYRFLTIMMRYVVIAMMVRSVVLIETFLEDEMS